MSRLKISEKTIAPSTETGHGLGGSNGKYAIVLSAMQTPVGKYFSAQVGKGLLQVPKEMVMNSEKVHSLSFSPNVETQANIIKLIP